MPHRNSWLARRLKGIADQPDGTRDETVRLRYQLAAAADALTDAETRIERIRDERDQARRQRDEARVYRDAFRRERDEHARTLAALGQVKAWRNEDGKKFVFVSDILDVLQPSASSGNGP